MSALDRLITALMNATGVTYRAIEATDDPDAGGSLVIAAVAERLRGALAPFAEHHTDDEIVELAGILAHITLLLADDLGLEGYFRPAGGGPGAAARG